ncbi:MAG: cytochrome c [Acidimicrobiia bacterium]|nr:MAG: cytochrome c [Acidimicrobiia bacterium]
MRRPMIALAALAIAVAACGGGDGGDTTAATTTTAAATGDATNGLALFNGTCIACHGEGGVGVEGLGKPFVNSEFIGGMSDADLVAFVTVGRDTSDPENTTGVAMPAKGGNPALTEADLYDIVAYLRTLQG